MDPEKIQARLQPRNAWQAMDLGARLYRSWWWPLTCTWLLFTLVPFCLLFLLSRPEDFFLVSLVFWFLKPLWEKPLLEYCGRALFSETPRPLALLKQFPRYGFTGLASLLTFRRLSPFRGFNLAVFQLERGKGEQLSRRLRVLHLPPSNRSGTLTLLMLHVEQALVLAFIILIYTLAPWQFNLELADWLMMRERTHQLIMAFSWYLAMSLTEPLYIASSFALYLNKRTWLEAWDLDLGLRRIGRRRMGLHGTTAALLLALPLFWPTDSMAAEPATPEQEAVTVLAGPDFMPMETQREWRQREWLRNQQWLQTLQDWFSDEQTDTPDNPATTDLSWLATALRFLVVVVIVSLLLWVAWRYRHLLQAMRTGGRRHSPPPSVAGLDIRAASLPGDIPGAVMAALDKGDARLALGLLYRASLSRLVQSRPLPLHPGTTESECLEILRGHLQTGPRLSLMEQLTPLWIRTAWAHQPPEREDVLECLRAWREGFESAPEAAHATP